MQAFLAAEDPCFLSDASGCHSGRATIVDQLVKSQHVGGRNLSRQLKEISLAFAISKTCSRANILNAYLDTIYLGQDDHRTLYGVRAAAHEYFGCETSDLTLEQAATVAGLARSPTRYSPRSHPNEARERRDVVLARMREAGFLR